MAPNLGLLQAIGDQYNQPLPETEPEERFAFSDNPAIQALLDSPSVDPVVKRNLREQEKQRRRAERLEFEINRLKNKEEFSRRSEDGSVVSFLGPVPVGFQFGTYAGIKNPIARFAVDLVADPINLIGGIGGLTKLGRASKVLKGMTPAQKAAKLVEGAEFLAKANLDEGLASAVKAAAESGDAKAIMRAFNRSKLRKIGADDIAKLKDLGVEDDFLSILKNPRKELRGLKEAFEFGADAKIDKLKGSFLGRVAEGQSAFVNFSVPFTDIDLGGVRFPSVVKAIAGDTGDVKALGAGLTENLSDTWKSLKDLTDVRESMVSKTARESFDPTNTSAMVKFAEDHVSLARDMFDPDTGIGSLLSKPILKTNIVEGVLAGKEGATWLGGGISVGRFTKETMVGVDNISEILESTLKSVFSEDQLKKLSAFREQTLKGGDEFFSSLNDGQRAIYEQFDKLMDDMAVQGQKLDVFKGSIDNYIPHIFEFKDQSLRKTMGQLFRAGLRGERLPNEFAKYARGPRLPGNKHGLTRFLETMEVAKKYAADHPELGMTLKTENFAELTSAYVRSAGTAMIKNQMLSAFKIMKADGVPLALQIPKQSGRITNEAKLAGDVLLRKHGFYADEFSGIEALKGWRFHKSIAGDVRNIFDIDFVQALKDRGDGFAKIVGAADRVNNIGKAALFNLLPFFHGMSLALSNFALLNPKVALQSLGDEIGAVKNFVIGKFSPAHREKAIEQIMSVYTRGISGAADGTGGVLSGKDLYREFLQSGIRRGRIASDTGYGAVDRLLSSVANTLPNPGASLAKGGKAWNDLSDKVLWSIMHEGLQLNAWVHLRNKYLLENPLKYSTKAGRLALNSEVGRIVQQAYGGILDRLVLHPSMRKAARFAFLAPDWTLSNFMMARDLFVNAPFIRDTAVGKSLTKDALLKDIRFRAALGYNMRAAFYSYIGGNALNYMFTGKWLFENDDAAIDPVTGLKTRIELPYKRADGRRQFMDISKQFAEPLKLMLNPTEFYSGKKGVLHRVYDASVVGIDSFGRPINGGKSGPFKKLVERAAVTTGQFAPIPLQSALQAQSGFRDPRSAAISAIGFNIRSEDKEIFERNQKLKELKQELELERSR